MCVCVRVCMCLTVSLWLHWDLHGEPEPDLTPRSGGTAAGRCEALWSGSNIRISTDRTEQPTHAVDTYITVITYHLSHTQAHAKRARSHRGSAQIIINNTEQQHVAASITTHTIRAELLKHWRQIATTLLRINRLGAVERTYMTSLAVSALNSAVHLDR